MKAWELEEGKEYTRGNESIRHRVFNGDLQIYGLTGWVKVTYGYNVVAKWEFKETEVKVTNKNVKVGEKILVRENEDDEWIERYFLALEHGKIYTTTSRNGGTPYGWRYGIKKEDN